MSASEFKPSVVEPGYTGRFAPSPTGPLHIGSLVAAMASYLDARSSQGRWYLRIEDLDPPREIPGSADAIIFSLERLGFEWDGPVTYQSHRHAFYEDAVESLISDKVAYSCKCSRKDIAEQQSGNPALLRYPGNCRNIALSPAKNLAIRALTEAADINFSDRLVGAWSQNIEAEVGDFVIRRKDGFYAYQLAVVIDDAEQKITHVVRGEDLLDSTPRQIHLQKLLDLPTPVYAHTPLVLDENGNKFSKSSNRGRPLKTDLETLLRAWHFLRQTPTSVEEFDTMADFWQWAFQHWNINKLVK